jgi:hypothetical protein
MFFHKGVLAGKEYDAVRRKDMFQFKAINAGSVSHLDIVMIIVVVEFIHDPDPERV